MNANEHELSDDIRVYLRSLAVDRKKRKLT